MSLDSPNVGILVEAYQKLYVARLEAFPANEKIKTIFPNAILVQSDGSVGTMNIADNVTFLDLHKFQVSGALKYNLKK